MSDPSEPMVKWLRDDYGRFIFFKHGAGLYSETRASAKDEIIVLKAIVRIKRKWIVAVPVDREMINEPDAADWTIPRLTEEAIYAARTQEEGPRGPTNTASA